MSVLKYIIQVTFFLFFVSITLTVQAQDSTLIYRASILIAGSTNQTPLWLHANKSGVYPLNGTFTSGQFKLNKIYNLNNPRVFQWSAGAELITNYGKRGDVFFTDLYVAGKTGPVELMIGQKSNMTGLVDSLLTSGSLAISDNSRPMPRIQISIPEFLRLGFTNNFIAFKASYSDGIIGGSNIVYGSEKYVSQTYLHQKLFYIRVGSPQNKFKVFTGFNHQAIWGEERKIIPIDNISASKAYWYVITGKTMDFKKVGTHFGTIDLAATYKGRSWTYFAYRQNIYETGSLFKIINFSDGLNGFKMQRINKKVKSEGNFIFNSFLIEFLSTTSQNNTNPNPSLSILSKGNYFNSLIYSKGWSYRDRVIGTPLIPNRDLTNPDLPRSSTEFTNNNRIRAIHTGINASWLNTMITVRGTYSINKGTYVNPFPNNLRQFSLGVDAEKKIRKLNNISVTAGLYSDFGKLYPNTSAITIGIRKNGYIN